MASLRCARRAVKRWAAQLGNALLSLGEARVLSQHAAHEVAARAAPSWRLMPERGSRIGSGAPLHRDPGLAVWLDVGPPVRAHAIRAEAAALGLDLGATLLWTGLGPQQLGRAVAAARALPHVACVVLDARHAEVWAAKALRSACHLPATAHETAPAAAVTVLAHCLPQDAPGSADLPGKWPKLDRLRGIA